MFVFNAGFPLKNANLPKVYPNKMLQSLTGSIVSFTHNDLESWQSFKYQAMGVLAYDLSAELTGLAL